MNEREAYLTLTSVVFESDYTVSIHVIPINLTLTSVVFEFISDSKSISLQ